jgi:GMP synthase-like glutamine amidotransferase
MKVVIFQHEKNEPAGVFEIIFEEQGIPFEYLRLFEDEKIDIRNTTHLLFMGGPMSVNDEDNYPYLVEEKMLIRDWIKKKKPVLGICLGAQLISSAMGGSVTRCENEIGWTEVRRLRAGMLSQFPGKFVVFQFHGETFEIPLDSTLLCAGERVRNQAFCCGTALGLQFHLELTEELIEDWVRGLGKSDQEKILRETEQYIAESTNLCRNLAGRFIHGS